MIERRWDEEAGILYVTATGNWTVAEVDAHYAALRDVLVELRARRQQIRILSDVTGAERQPAELEEHIKALMLGTFRPGDRMAILTAGADDQQYLRTRLAGIEIAVFASRLPAEMWLLMDAQAA